METSNGLFPEKEGGGFVPRRALYRVYHFEPFNNITVFCIQVLVMPRFLYYPLEDIYAHWEKQPPPVWVKRELITAITAATLMALGITGTVTGVTSLVQQQNGWTSLRAAVDEDLERLE